MRPYDIIVKKRDGGINTKEEIKYMIEKYVEGKIPDYQIASWLMAIYFKHMTSEERYNLTMTMLESGDKVDLSAIEGKKIDKHSTGGVGDKTTISLAPMVASIGLKVSKLSGRGLGHTGGTVDKLEAIPGFKTALSEEEFFKIANEKGVVVAGQTANIAPADKKIYALRDTTATVNEISLISASIMSKKLGIMSDGIVLDVKTGSGAFMKSIEESVELAKAMVDIAKKNGKKVTALVTNMDQPLGYTVGNSLEVLEAIQTVKGEIKNDFTELCLELSAHMVDLSGIMSYEKAKEEIQKNIYNGKVKEIMKEWIKSQGGNPEVVENPEKILNISNLTYDFISDKNGYITHIDAESVGISSMLLGAGRASKEDIIDTSVGIKIFKKLGDEVKVGEKIATLYYSEEKGYEEALKKLKESYIIKDEKPHENKTKLIYEIVK
ncbi:pyrimidine-nucleoside phosphorylase [Oceanotoga teriensis]|jgi:pyrimidine-nucleoside phosphorylase|uniref:Pyrimidine-nucleoside phosphorylase n=1 Tax=Oceanotoga teriensis TaxID=515440 RepID=A0AA45C9D1_9BACT|nr:thymidine phosphorylase [Oceanotoga teriensis]PWJ96717.1 pyrimidine-nucleoside phosphorylase [Oceanotoga teriensis]